jgi:hypothetical protein
MAHGPEYKVKKAVRLLLEQKSAYQYWPVMGAFGKRGIDIYASYRGFFIAIECKRPGSVPTEKQEGTLREIALSGAYAICEDSVECLKVRSVLNDIDQRQEVMDRTILRLADPSTIQANVAADADGPVHAGKPEGFQPIRHWSHENASKLVGS